ncbi:hypothetical protein Patl1_23487 [Pistacia atlantica]|uniref:Uncharacterized protein n=1 Tax=Pistacia atlantica TaxID=434234 RepID=A0ACC0ZTR9_9ROSI|nr:hypothetical protein Patl1_23487 [Pistacia atlantica]
MIRFGLKGLDPNNSHMMEKSTPCLSLQFLDVHIFPTRIVLLEQMFG